jgi:penicillin-binding protein 1A
MSVVLDGTGRNFAEVFEPGNRRIWMSLSDVPDYVQKAFVAAEDRRFFQHHGIDERGMIRAFIGNLSNPRRPQGGSTITQQIVKNLLVGEDVTYERKIREMIVAAQLETNVPWGIEMAARSYFGKSAKNLTLGEGAMLAGLLKGPSYYTPDRHPDRAIERFAYVLDRMQEDGVISAEQKDEALAAGPKLVALDRPHRDSGFQFVDFLRREAKTDGFGSLTAKSYTVHSTINAQLQHESEAALQEGLAQYEISSGRIVWHGPEANIADSVQRFAADNHSSMPAWQRALQALHLPLYDVHWTRAVVVQKGQSNKNGNTMHVGLPDGRIAPLTSWTKEIIRSLNLYDVVFVHVIEPSESLIKSGDAKATYVESNGANANADKRLSTNVQAQLPVPPVVQGAALVLENKTGRILAMAGSFSYPLSQLNRTWQSVRQPGSAIKPITYLTALQKGLQPNTLVRDEPITLPPIGRATKRHGAVREEDYWTPQNADHRYGGVFTLRRGLEFSRNVVTAHLLDGGINADPEKSLDQVCATAVAAKIYPRCIRYYPFVLGAQPVRMIDLAAFYAAVANEGALPRPHAIESIEADDQVVYQYPDTQLPFIGVADRATFYQLKTMLQGVVARGTARAIDALSPYVAGKTGTTEDAVDGWFVGFTNDVTVAVWVGYDNANGKRRSLGSNETGARVALPIFRPIIEAIWAGHVAPKAPLSRPSPDAQRQLVDLAIDYDSGDRASRGRGFTEHFRLGPDAHVHDTQYQVAPRLDTTQAIVGSSVHGDNAPSAVGGAWWAQIPARNSFQDHYNSYYSQQPVRRRDTDYFWRERF